MYQKRTTSFFPAPAKAWERLKKSNPEVVEKCDNLRFPDPAKAWERLIKAHPEVVQKVDNLVFPGPGQRETPVAKDKEAAYYILGLLPGAVGQQYVGTQRAVERITGLVASHP